MRQHKTCDLPPLAAVAHFAGSCLYSNDSWGSASLHPRLYAAAALRGLNASQYLDQSFLKSVGHKAQSLYAFAGALQSSLSGELRLALVNVRVQPFFSIFRLKQLLL